MFCKLKLQINKSKVLLWLSKLLLEGYSAQIFYLKENFNESISENIFLKRYFMFSQAMFFTHFFFFIDAF